MCDDFYQTRPHGRVFIVCKPILLKKERKKSLIQQILTGNGAAGQTRTARTQPSKGMDTYSATFQERRHTVNTVKDKMSGGPRRGGESFALRGGGTEPARTDDEDFDSW